MRSYWHALAALVMLPAPSLLAQQLPAGGTYTDASGRKHPWNITPTHALVWNREPYVPVGGVFCPRYFAEGQTEAAWEADRAALDLLKSKGLTDLLINPVISAADIPPPAWQRLIDYLEERGFRYGIAFGEGIASPLTGTLVKPGSYRIPDVERRTELRWRTGDAQSARFVLANRDGTIARLGEARIQGGSAVVETGTDGESESVGLLYPRKTLKPSGEGWLPDVWSGFDSYRDRLLSLFANIKLGPGLRFFLDPLGARIGIPTDAEYLVPDSPSFRMEWEAYLSRAYRGIEELLTRWAVLDREVVEEISRAADLIPLWSARRGVPYFLDTRTGKTLEMDRATADQSRFWADLRQWRNDSLAYYMSAIADILKREVADVPVVYTFSHQHRIFTNTQTAGGFDGLGISAYGRGSALVTGGADAAYGQASEARRAMWLLVTETLDSRGEPGDGFGYESEQALFLDLDRLRSIGAKGLFVCGYQILPEQAHPGAQLIKAPEQLDWLKRYDDRLHRETDLTVSRPATLPYPAAAAGLVQSGPIGGGSVWWVPSLAPGTALDYGSYTGYSITLPEGDTTVLWSRYGPRETHFVMNDPRGARVMMPDGRPVEAKVDLKKRLLTVVLTETPVLIRGSGEQPLPLEAVEDAIRQLAALIEEGRSARQPMEEYLVRLDGALRSYKKTPRTAYYSVIDSLNKLGAVLQPYAWLEAEAAQSHTFGETTLSEAASGGGFLLLNTEMPPTSSGYGVTLRFNAPADDLYTVWVACTPPGLDASPFTWVIDGANPQTSAEAAPVGAPYLYGRLVWMRLGKVQLARGERQFTLNVSGKTARGEKYYLALDSVLITRGPFTPAGTARPPLVPISPSEPLPAPKKR